MKRSNLDEMQEQKLTKLESRGFWLTYWLLAAAILIQVLLTGYADMALGELAVFVIVSIYLVAGCLRLGIWDRRLKANAKTNLIGGGAAGGFVAVFLTLLYLSRNGWQFQGWMAAAALISGLAVFALCFGVLSLCAAIYKKRNETLERE